MTLNRLHEIGTFCIKEIDNRLKRSSPAEFGRILGGPGT